MAVRNNRIEDVLTKRQAWLGLVRERHSQLRHFLRWAAACEDGAPESSLRFEFRQDMARCRRVLELFSEPWWAVAVYSCFDSEIGSNAAKRRFAKPLSRTTAQEVIDRDLIDFPPRSVQNHRAQATLARAKMALVSICDQAPGLKDVMCDPEGTFEERLRQLKRMNIDGWGRTTYFDALARAGVLKVGAATYRPQKAHLAGSTGPKKGFAKVWGIEPGRGNIEACEDLLQQWTRDWQDVASAAGVKWDGRPYDSADFENALCIFQERLHKYTPHPAAFAV